MCCYDVLRVLVAHEARLGGHSTAPPVLWGAAVGEQGHVGFRADAIAQVGLAGWRFVPEPASESGDAATAFDAGSRAGESAAAGCSGGGAPDSVGLPKFLGRYAEKAGGGLVQRELDRGLPTLL